jgi:hypothetical protein
VAFDPLEYQAAARALFGERKPSMEKVTLTADRASSRKAAPEKVSENQAATY